MSRGFMYGKLDPSKKVIEATREEWSRSFEDPSSRVVQQDSFEGGWFLSTVFLGLNHAFSGGEGIWFETMLFGPNGDSSEERRYRTYEDALRGHNKIAAELERDIGKPKRAPTEQELTRYGFRKIQA